MQKEELDSFVRLDVVNKTAVEIIDLMAQRSMILCEAQKVLKAVEYRLGLVRIFVPEE